MASNMSDAMLNARGMNGLGELAPGQTLSEDGSIRNIGKLGSPGAPGYVTGSLSVTRKARVTSAGEVFQREIKLKRGRHKVTTNMPNRRRPIAVRKLDVDPTAPVRVECAWCDQWERVHPILAPSWTCPECD